MTGHPKLAVCCQTLSVKNLADERNAADMKNEVPAKADYFDRTSLASGLWLQTLLYYNMLLSLMVYPFLIAVQHYKVRPRRPPARLLQLYHSLAPCPFQHVCYFRRRHL